MNVDERTGHELPSRLNQIASQLSHAWIPVHPQVLERIRSGLAEGYYQKNREKLVEDLKADCGLYLLCLRELSLSSASEAAEKEGAPKTDKFISAASFSSLLSEAPLEKIEKVLALPLGKISFHSLENMSRFQADRLAELVVSANTSEILSAELGLDAQSGYNCALLRQLGLTLAAWNYPQLYRQAQTMLRDGSGDGGSTLDGLLQSLLGFSPAVLGVRVAQSWGLAPSVTEPLLICREEPPNLRQLVSRHSLKTAAEEKSLLLAQICAVGEALARASHPGTYPQARNDWKQAEQVIVDCLGADGMEKICARAQALSADYASFAPQLFQNVQLHAESGTIESAYARRKLQANLFLRICPEEIKKTIVSVYRRLQENVDEGLVRDFLFQVIPSIGYSSSCIFMLDPAAASLVPMFKVGSPAFVKARAIHLAGGAGATNPVRAAFSQRTPLLEEGMHGGESRLFVAGAIGEKRGIGVLYLELSPQAPYLTKKEQSSVFQTVRQCLHDLFHLE